LPSKTQENTGKAMIVAYSQRCSLEQLDCFHLANERGT
jgi:hypothetical protein